MPEVSFGPMFPATVVSGGGQNIDLTHPFVPCPDGGCSKDWCHHDGGRCPVARKAHHAATSAAPEEPAP